jgi:hypothetical protein
MKCAACGMPLSPNRQQATCPKCGTPVSTRAGQKAASGAVQHGFPEPSAFNSPPQSPLSPPPPPRQEWQVWQPVGQQPPANNRSVRPGFTIAGLCILAGALLLILVYVLAISGQGNQQNITTQQNTPRPTVIPSPTSNPSPTATALPGQQYIDNAQISSSPPPNLQATNTVKKGQNFYVSFDVHPGGQSGVVCLVWYLNGQKANSYTIPVGVHSTSSYGTEIIGSPGSGSVNLYWATDATCSNELLAQQVTFTVTG